MITTSLFLIISAAALVLFVLGLGFVYYGHTLGFLSNVLSLVMLWSMTAMSAFGSVGDTVYNQLYSWKIELSPVTIPDLTAPGLSGGGNGDTAIEAVTTLIDPALVYLSLFTSILCTVVFILVLVRFVMDNIAGKNPEMEDESE